MDAGHRIDAYNDDQYALEPKGEYGWLVFKDTDGNPLYIITSKGNREYYYMYQVFKDRSIKKLGRDKSPAELERKFAPIIVSSNK